MSLFSKIINEIKPIVQALKFEKLESCRKLSQKSNYKIINQYKIIEYKETINLQKEKRGIFKAKTLF